MMNRHRSLTANGNFTTLLNQHNFEAVILMEFRHFLATGESQRTILSTNCAQSIKAISTSSILNFHYLCQRRERDLTKENLGKFFKTQMPIGLQST